MDNKIKCVAIVVAGGGGSRFGGDVPKQFLPLSGLPVLAHSLRALEVIASVGRVILVVSEGYLEHAEGIVSEHGFAKVCRIIAGGDCRRESVGNALKVLEDEGFDGLVLVHDAARPFVDADAVHAVLDAARENGAATLGTVVTDTIKLANGGKVQETLPREKLFAVQTPQAFRAEILFEAHKKADDNAGYDDCQLVEKIGVSPRIVIGSSLNIKITHAIDMVVAKHILRRDDL